MSIQLFKLTDNAVELNDLGITLTGLTGTSHEITDEQANDIYLSANGGDIEAAINGTTPFGAAELLLVDPRTGYTGNLNAVQSLIALRSSNDVHYGIQGANLADMDDVDAGAAEDEVLQYVGGVYTPVPASTIAANIALDDLSDVADGTAHTLDTLYVYKGDGTNLNVVEFGTDPAVVEAVEDIIGAAFTDGDDSTFVYNDAAGTMQVNVDDVFLRNTGDTLDSGALTIASGASIVVATGAVITITDAPVNPTDGVNKEYVDAIASGISPKDSAQIATTADLGFTYLPGASPTDGEGDTLTAPAVGVTTIDGEALVLGARVLVKNQTSTLENGIYDVTTLGDVGTATILTRSTDFDGTPANEVSEGSYVFVSHGATQAASGWIVTGTAAIPGGDIVVGTDPILWAQFSESSDFTAGEGLKLTGSVFSLDIDNLTAATIEGADEIAFNDTSDTNAPKNTTVTDFLSDLEIPNGITSDGLVTNDGGVWSSTAIVADGAGNLDGITITNGDATTGSPTVGLDINGLPARSDAIDLTDRIAVYNITTGANEFYTVNELATAGSSTAFGIIVTDSGTATADSASDTVTYTGDGIATSATAGATAAVDFALDISSLTAGAGTLSGTDLLAIDDGTATNKGYTLQDVIDDLDIATGIGASTGLVVSDGAGGLTSVDIVVSGAGAEAGLTITNGDGQAGDPTVGLDITGAAAAAEDLAADDEIIVYNTSNTANEKMTGQELADGVASMISFPGGLAITTIGGQEVLTVIDTTRTNKVLSVETTAVTWSENRVGNNDWMQIGTAVDALSGYVMPLDATIVKVTAQTSDDNNNNKDIDLYVDGTLTTAGIAAFNPAVNGENTYTDVTLNVDVNAGQKLRLRGAATGGNVDDIVVTIWVKWRG